MELATPIIFYWDLPDETADSDTLLWICAEIIACRPLMLHLRVPGPEIGEGAAVLLNRLKGAPPAVSLTIPPVTLDRMTWALFRFLGLKEVLLAGERVDAFREKMAASRLLSAHEEGEDQGRPGMANPALGISFAVSGENWRELPALIAFCREEGITRLVLPMQRLYDGAPPFFLDREEQGVLADDLAAVGGVAGMEITIHDPFLWQAFHPEVPFPQGGCQAANTMLAIAPDNGVYPCPTLPVHLGDLGKNPLREIVASSAKKEFRRRLLENPAGCRECGELAACRGGCRGRAYAVHGSLDGADPACELHRSPEQENQGEMEKADQGGFINIIARV
jgi:GeoRSP system SPASM domain protein